MRRASLPALVALTTAAAFVYGRDYPWQPALVVGLSFGVLFFGLRRSFEQLRRTLREHRAPLELWHHEGPSTPITHDRPRPDDQTDDQEPMRPAIGRPADEQQEEPGGYGRGTQPEP